MLTYVLQVWFYMSPALYGVDQVPARVRPLLILNPFASLFTAFRDVLMLGRPPDMAALGSTAAVGVLLCLVSLKIFFAHENDFAKLVA